jgi:hypothetical protein
MRLLIFMASVANRIGSITGTFALQGLPPISDMAARCKIWRHETHQSSHAPTGFYRVAQRG